MLGWALLSQRCGLSQLLKAKQAMAVEHECCQKNNSQPDNTPIDGSRTAECCKVLNVLMPDTVKLPDGDVAAQVFDPVEWFVVLSLALSDEGRVCPAFGLPPDVPAFAELVLQRSLLSHAPPYPA